MQRLFKSITLSALLGLTLVIPALAAGASHLSPAQASIVAAKIAELRYPQERAVADGWTDAKKAAEFICRPLGSEVLKRQFQGADRVFLGTGAPDTLRLSTDRLLEGSGQVRTGNSWRGFHFACTLDPVTGRALAFKPKMD